MCLRLGPGQRRALDANNTSASGAIFDNYLTLILFPHALGRNVHEACTYRDTNSLVDIGGSCGYSTNGSGGQFWGRKFAFRECRSPADMETTYWIFTGAATIGAIRCQ